MSVMRSPVKDAINRINAGKTHYEVLGVSSTSSSDEIKKSFRSLSLLVHPDKSGEKTEDVFNLVRLAYETLKEPSSRQSYDLKLRSEAQFKSGIPSWQSWSHFSHVNVNVSRPPPPKKNANNNNNNNNNSASDWPSGMRPNTLLENRAGLRNVTCSHCKREIYMEPEVYARFCVTEELARCCSCNKEFAQVSCPSCRAEYIVNYVPNWRGSVNCTNELCKKEFPLNYPPPPNTPLWFSFMQKRKAPKTEEQLRRENDIRLQQEAVERSRREAEMLRARKQAEAAKKEELKRKVSETEQKFASSTNLNSNSTNTSNTNTFTFPTFSHTSPSAPNTTSQTQNSHIHSTIFGNSNPHTQTKGTNGFPSSTTSTTTTTTTSTTTTTATGGTSSSTISRRAASRKTKKTATKKAASNGLSSFFSSSVSSKSGIATSSQNFAKKKRKGSDGEETAPSDVTDSEDEKPRKEKDKKKRKVDSGKKKGKVRKGRSSDSEDSSKKKKKKLNPRNSGTKRKSRTHESSYEDEDSDYDSMSDEEEEEYEVEDILNKRVLNGNVQYYVKWANYNEEECTWEPDYNLTHCPEIIEKFERRRSGSVL